MTHVFRLLKETYTGQNPVKELKAKLLLQRALSEPEHKEHREALDDLCLKYHTDAFSGITSTKDSSFKSFVKKNRRKHGRNVCTVFSNGTWFRRYATELITGLLGPMWLCALIFLASYFTDDDLEHLYTSLFIAIAIMINGTVAALSRDRADKIVDFFAGVDEFKFKVIRDGREFIADAREIVAGDLLVELSEGKQIPADAVILECTEDCFVENSSVRQNDHQLSKRSAVSTHDHPLESENMIFRGTHVAVGTVSRAIVVRVGDQTQVGRMLLIAGLAKKPVPPILKELDHCELLLIKVCLCMAFIGGIAAVIFGFTDLSALTIAAGFALASLPVALKGGAVICAHMSLERLEERGIHLKDVNTLENLGATSCVFTDRAGFISEDNLTVAAVAIFDRHGAVQRYSTGTQFSDFEDTYSDASRLAGLEALHRCAILTLGPATKFVGRADENAHTRFADDGRLVPFSEGVYDENTGRVFKKVNWATVGDDVEGSILKFYHDQNTASFRKLEEVHEVQDSFPLLYRMPFRRESGFELQVRCNYRGEISTNNKSRVVFMKGQPEIVIPRCTRVRYDSSGTHDMSHTAREEINDLVAGMGDEGLHVIALAESEELRYRQYGKTYHYEAADDLTSATFPVGFTPSQTSRSQMLKDLAKAGPRAVEGLVFLGLIAMHDPVREDIHTGIRQCHNGHVRLILTTGAHPNMAMAVARQTGIFPTDDETDYEISRYNEYVQSLMDKGLENDEERIAHIAHEHTIRADFIKQHNLHTIRSPKMANAAVIICDDTIFAQDDGWWEEKLTQYQHLVVSRCQFQHKELVIRHARRVGHVTLCTGNLPRDVPSLKQAHVGAAMGPGAAEAARENADVIAVDMHLGIVVDGISEGRLLFENLKKMLTFCLVTNVPQMVAFLMFICAECPLPLSTTMILLIDVGMNLIPTLGMGLEVAEGNLMERPPRNVFLDKLIPKGLFILAYLQLGMIQAFAGLFAYAVVMNDFGYPPHLLATLGQNNNWGNYPLYCKFVGGQYVNEKGTIDAQRHPERHPPRSEYPLWDDGDHGYVEDCVFPVKNFWGNDNYPRSQFTNNKFKIGTAASYTHSTVDRTMATVEIIEALHENGYFEYTPWKSRMSSWWKTDWLAYDILGEPEALADNQIPVKSDVQMNNDITLENHQIVRYFSKYSLGLWSICLEDPTFSYRKGVVWSESESQKDSIGGWNASHSTVTGCHGGPDALARPNDDKAYRFSKALFCNGDRSYERIANGGMPTYDLTATKLEYAAAQGAKCQVLDDHVRQLKYCQDSCSIECETVPAALRGNETTWDGERGYKVKQCANIGSRMAQRETLHSARTAYTVAVILCQICAAMVLRTRWHSLYQHGIDNFIMNFGVHSILLFLVLVVYSPWGHQFGGTRSLRFIHWLPGIPWAVFLTAFEECRKLAMRVTTERDPKSGKRIVGWVESVSYF